MQSPSWRWTERRPGGGGGWEIRRFPPPRKNEIMKWHFPRSAKASFFLFIAAEKMGNCWADEMGSWFLPLFLVYFCGLIAPYFKTVSQKRTEKKYLLPEALNEFPYQEDRRIRTVMKGDEFQQHFSVKIIVVTGFVFSKRMHLIGKNIDLVIMRFHDVGIIFLAKTRWACGREGFFKKGSVLVPFLGPLHRGGRKGRNLQGKNAPRKYSPPPPPPPLRRPIFGA